MVWMSENLEISVGHSLCVDASTGNDGNLSLSDSRMKGKR